MKKAKSEADNKVEYGTVSLPIVLINKIKKSIQGTGMNSVSAYVAFVLREILSDSKENKSFSKEETNIRKRLNNLGYL